MFLAIDQKKTLDLALRDLRQVGEHHHVCPIHPAYAKLPMFTRDVEQAKKRLAEAGYSDSLNLEIAGSNDPTWIPAAMQTMVEQWKDAGIDVKINLMPGAAFWDVWDKMPFGCTQWYHRPLAIMTLGLAYRYGVAWNESDYSNPEFDQLLSKAEGLVDVDERLKVTDEIEKLMQEDGPLVCADKPRGMESF